MAHKLISQHSGSLPVVFDLKDRRMLLTFVVHFSRLFNVSFLDVKGIHVYEDR